jgi:cytochrome c-type biogenesis protein CcmE
MIEASLATAVVGRDRDKRLKTILLTIAMIVGFAIAATVVLWGLSEKAKYEREAEVAYKKYASDIYYPQRYACQSLPALNKIDCIAKQEAHAREYERSEQDLVAQRLTAIWTILMGCAAVIGMVLSAIGVILVYTTFDETRKANELTKAGQRPWLSVDKLHVKRVSTSEIDGGYKVAVQFSAVIRNSGPNPAKNLIISPFIINNPNNTENLKALERMFQSHRRDRDGANRGLIVGGGTYDYASLRLEMTLPHDPAEPVAYWPAIGFSILYTEIGNDILRYTNQVFRLSNSLNGFLDDTTRHYNFTRGRDEESSNIFVAQGSFIDTAA